MITPEHERPRSGEGAVFTDTVAIDFCDPKHDTFGMAQLARRPAAGRAMAIGLLFARGELVLERVQLDIEAEVDSWRDAEVAGVHVATEAPLQRWSASLSGPEGGFEITLAATSPPVDLCEPPTPAAQAAAVGRYEHLCRVHGEVKLQGRSHPVECVGQRTHTWGATDWDGIEAWRSLYAASDDGRGASVTAARPAGSEGHGDELVAGHLLEAAVPPLLLDRVYLSTVYDASRQPRKAGLELYLPGDEFPRRLGGQALCSTPIDLGGQTLCVSFFRWSMDGKPAFGRYETVYAK